MSDSKHRPKQRIVVGLSGGVDSAVTAWLLKRAGHEVVGIFMKNWEEEDDDAYCSSRQDFLDAASVADVIGIEIEHVNFAAEYRDRVFAEFLREYQAGRTPNPDVLCNAEIKFKAFLDHAVRLGAEKIATGHYARIRASADDGFELLRGLDTRKDQSYFLHRLNQAQLSRTLFPIGELEKTEVRRIAAEIGLPNAKKKDSTGICFIGERPFREFLNRYLANTPGPIEDERGRTIGEHVGLSFYTLGQRKGIGIGGLKERGSARGSSEHAPWFVARKDLARNVLHVVRGHDHPWLHSDALIAADSSWIAGRPPAAGTYACKTRYRQGDAACEFLRADPAGTLALRFETPQWAVTPGQSAVLYDGERCLGGAVIEATTGATLETVLQSLTTGPALRGARERGEARHTIRTPACVASTAMLEASDAPALSPTPRPRAQTGSSTFPVAIAAFIWLAFSIGARPLSLPDEGRYVGVAWEMLRSGDWLVPTENGLPFFHKPPLFYWLTAGAMRIFGPSLWAARCAPLLGAMLGAAALYLLTRRWVGERSARVVLAVLLLQPFFFGAAQFANLDMLVAGCIAASIAAAAHAVLLMREHRSARAAIVGAWLAAAFGVLAKGLIGVALPLLVVLCWLLATGQRRAIPRLLSPLAIAVFALVATPWFLAMQARFPDFAHYFVVVQHVQRFAAGGFNNVQPWWFFIVAVPLLTLPWSGWLLCSRFGSRSGDPEAMTHWRGLMWIWLIVVAVFFSIPESKPVGYIMPLLFPLAALAADAMTNRLRIGSLWAKRAAAGSFGLAALVCLALVFGIAANYRHDDTALAGILRQLRGPEDPVVFVGEYFFDVPFHARLTAPVMVVSDWHDPTIAQRDSWRHELADAATFAPGLGASLLVDANRGLSPRCGAPLWVFAKDNVSRPMPEFAAATRIANSNDVTLWRLGPAGCGNKGGNKD